MSLAKQSFNGVFWTLLDVLVNKGAFFLASIILANILGPEVFGLIGMLAIFVAFSNTLIDSGMSTSIIRSESCTEKDYLTIFWANTVLSIIVYFLLYGLAPWIADFFEEPILTPVLRVYALGFVFIGLKTMYQAKLVKTMSFRAITIKSLPGNIVSTFVAIWMGYNGYGVWSMVWLYILNHFISLLVFALSADWRPSWLFDRPVFMKHFKFGYKLFLSAQLNILAQNMVNILLGKFYSAKTLGYYERAFTLNNYPVSILSGIVTKVSLPLLTGIKEDTERLQGVYKRIMLITFLSTSSALALAYVNAESLILLLLGDQWTESIAYFKVLCLAYVLFPLHALNINVLSLYGRSDLFLKLEFIKKGIMFAYLFIGFQFGVQGLLWSTVASSVTSLFINTYYSGKFLSYPTRSQLIDVLRALLFILVSIAGSFILVNFGPFENHYIRIVLSSVVFVVGVALTGEISKYSVYQQLKGIILQKIKR